MIYMWLNNAYFHYLRAHSFSQVLHKSNPVRILFFYFYFLEFLNNGEDNRIRLSYSTENIYGSLKYMLFLVKDLIVA